VKAASFLLSLSVLAYSFASQVRAEPIVDLTVTVVRAGGGPVTNAQVEVRFGQTGVVASVVQGVADTNGVFRTTNTTWGLLHVTTKASGYHDGFTDAEFTGVGPWSTNVTVPMEELRSGTVTVQVIGLDGQPIQGAHVGIGFEQSEDSWSQEEGVEGDTDANGQYTVERRSTGDFGGSAGKAGYYTSGFSGHLTGDPAWSASVNVVLKERKNPIPMYAKEAELAKPDVQTNTWYGYDLIVGDWVQPHGKGLTNDFLFKTDGYYNSPDDFDSVLSLSFSHPNDGVVLVHPSEGGGSELRSSQEAPTNGYANSRNWQTKRQGGLIADERLDGVDYYFRVRSATNAQGQVTNALYGKIYGDIGYMRFLYYLNSDGTRNVEFDPRRNLFPTPGGRGKISAP